MESSMVREGRGRFRYDEASDEVVMVVEAERYEPAAVSEPELHVGVYL